MFLGVDLGTTNCSAALCTDEIIEDLPLKQAVSEGVFEDSLQLPSYFFIPREEEKEHYKDWPGYSQLGGVCGVYAREQLYKTPSRVISSAKSWLSLSNENSRNKILPFVKEGLDSRIEKLSPVEVSSHYLSYIAKQCPVDLSSASVVVTVPASFDQLAKQLTLDAAAQAGFSDAILLEEPMAAFYNWLFANHGPVSFKNVLVVDVGGGTTDFSLITRDSGNWKRDAVGEHLLLGGDNMDLALALFVEKKAGVHFDTAQLHQAICSCREAKELLLSQEIAEYEGVILSSGSSLFKKQIQYHIGSQELEELILDGFFPVIQDFNEPDPVRSGKGLYELGLPFEKEPGITRHLKKFLKKYCPQGPDAVLYHGGSLISKTVQSRIQENLKHWFGSAPSILHNPDSRLGVSHGACIYAMARDGRFDLIEGGLPRDYFVKIARTGDSPVHLCIGEKGQSEGVVQHISHQFQLKGNQQVAFPFASGKGDCELGQFQEEESSLHSLPDLIVKLPSRQDFFPVALTSLLLPTGELRISLENLRDKNETFKLDFDFRTSKDTRQIRMKLPKEAEEMIESVYSKSEAKIKPAGLLKRLESSLSQKRNQWSADLCRHLGKTFLSRKKSRRKTSSHERAWMNSVGFLLRPGFGHPLDKGLLQDFDYSSFTIFPESVQNRVEYWVMLRRLSGAIPEDMQNLLMHRYGGYVFSRRPLAKLPGGSPGEQERLEMLRCFCCFEFLDAEKKSELAKYLIKQFKQRRLEDKDLWLLSRLLRRTPLYATPAHVISSEYGNRFLKEVLESKKQAEGSLINVLEELVCSPCPRAASLDKALCDDVIEKFSLSKEKERGENEQNSQKASFGEVLPLGLKLLG